jgi:hypothetical protein
MVLGVSTIARRRLNGKAAADRGWDAIVIGERELGGVCRVGGQYAMFAASSRACSDAEDRAAILAALRVAL